MEEAVGLKPFLVRAITTRTMVVKAATASDAKKFAELMSRRHAEWDTCDEEYEVQPLDAGDA